MQTVQADLSLPIKEFKKNPAAAMRQANGHPMAVLTHSKPTFYAVPPELFEKLLEASDNAQLTYVARTRLKAKTVAVDLDSL